MKKDTVVTKFAKQPSFFESTRSPYYIYAPDYRDTSAGIRCLHVLCHALNELGEEAYVLPATSLDPSLRTPRLTHEVMRNHFIAGRVPIAVYPEIVFGNPLNVPIAARWLLNLPGHLNGDTLYDANDLVFFYEKSYVPDGMAGTELRVPSINLSIFNNLNNPNDAMRKGSCYYARKYLENGGVIDNNIQNNSTSLCLDIPRSQIEIADILRKSEVLYCYEPSSLVMEALFCGCAILIVPSEYWDQYGDNAIFKQPGIGLLTGPDALLRMKTKWSEYRKLFAAMPAPDREMLQGAQEDRNWQQVRDFVTRTQHAAQVYIDTIAANINPQVLLHDIATRTSRAYVWTFPSIMRHRHEAVFDQMLSDLTVRIQGGPEYIRNPSLMAYRQWLFDRTPKHAEIELWKSWQANWPGLPDVDVVIAQPDEGIDLASSTLGSLASGHYKQFRAKIFDRSSREGAECADRIELQDYSFERIVEHACNSTATWQLWLSAGDQVEPMGLSRLLGLAHLNPDWVLVYSDSDFMVSAGLSSDPVFRPGFNLDLLRNQPGYIGKSVLLRTDALRAICRESLPLGLADIAFRVLDCFGPRVIGHVPFVLLHRAKDTASVLDSRATEQAAIQAHLERRGVHAEVVDGPLPDTFRVLYGQGDAPKACIIIRAGRDIPTLNRCLENLLGKTSYPAYEILLVDDGVSDPSMLAFLDGIAAMGDPHLSCLSVAAGMSSGAIWNLAAQHADATCLIFLDVMVTEVQEYWLETLVGHVMRQEVGAVAPRFLSIEGRPMDSAVILGGSGSVGRINLSDSLEDPGRMNRGALDQNVSALAGSCLMVRHSVFDETGGFDAEFEEAASAQVDFCLRLGRRGYLSVFTPNVLLAYGVGGQDGRDSEPISSGNDLDLMYKRWLPVLAHDPAYNPNLSLVKCKFTLENDPALLPSQLPWHPVPRVLVHPSDNGWSGHYRTLYPLREMRDKGCVEGLQCTRAYSPVEIERIQPDVVVFQRYFMPAQVHYVKSVVKYSSAFKVCELDELFVGLPYEVGLRQNLSPDNLKALEESAATCDRLIVSTAPLAEAYKGWNGDVRVVPSYLPRSLWGEMRPVRRAGSLPRVGWLGGVGDEYELGFLAEIIKALSNEVNWVFMGSVSPDVLRLTRDAHEIVSIEKFPARLASLNLDLALAPLETNAFNEAKSNLPLLEYGVLGYPVICTDILPYQGDIPVKRLPNNPKRWIHAIRERIRDLDALEKEGDALRGHVRANWMLEDHLDRWKNAWLP